jgi:hypothetical protein
MGRRCDEQRRNTTVQSEVWSMTTLQEDKLKRSRINHYAIHMTALNMERQPGRLRGIMTRLTAAMPSRPAAAELPAAPARTANAVPRGNRLRPQEA